MNYQTLGVQSLSLDENYTIFFFLKDYPAASAGLNSRMFKHSEAKFRLSYLLRADRFSAVAKFVS